MADRNPTLEESDTATEPAAWARPVQSEERNAHATDFVRVRLLVAIPVMIVLLLVVMGGVIYQFVELYFAPPLTRITAQTLQEFATVFLIILGIFAAGGVLVGTYLAWSITQPIRQIVSLSERVARGDFTPKAPVDRRDEMGQLGSSFNQMVESLNAFITSRNRFILESFSGGLITTDTDGTVVAMNSAAEKMLGLRAADAVGNNSARVFNRPGTVFVAGLIQEVLWKQEPVHGRTVEVGTNGHTRVLSVNCSPMRDEEGNVFGLIINLRDLEEMQHFYEHMYRADRLATLGTFAAGLAHEVRNPLGAIKGTAQLLAEDVRTNARAYEYTQVIVKEVNRLDALVREVQEFSHPAPSPSQLTDLTLLARETVALARNHPSGAFAQDITISESYEELPPTVVSREKLTQALLNIVLNALQATPVGGQVEIATEHVPKSTQPLRIRVTNTGSSIPADRITRIFEPFFTTKEKGTGLGLSIAYQIVRHHGGDIEVRSGRDQVTFLIKLPVDGQKN